MSDRNLWQRINDAAKDIDHIGKDDTNKSQGFQFRGIDATMQACAPAFRKHGIVVAPVAVEMLPPERYQTRGGGQMVNRVAVFTYRFINVDNPAETLDVVMPGEASDAGDKASGKTASMALKSALFQALMLPTGETDADELSHERAAPVKESAEPDPRAKRLLELIKQMPEDMRDMTRTDWIAAGLPESPFELSEPQIEQAIEIVSQYSDWT